MERILIITTDSEQRELFKGALEEVGYEVIVAPDGEAGIKRFYQQVCPLVITDIFMPEKDGLEVIRELRKEFFGVRIIAMSGASDGILQIGGSFADDWALGVAEQFGANCTLRKPITQAQLVATVAELFRPDQGGEQYEQAE